MLRQILESQGYEVIDAQNGNEGMRLFRMKPADLVITEIIMLEKEGIEVIRELRSEFPRVKIIAMTKASTIGRNTYLLEIAKMLGAQFTFEKPFKREELLDALRKSLKYPLKKSNRKKLPMGNRYLLFIPFQNLLPYSLHFLFTCL